MDRANIERFSIESRRRLIRSVESIMTSLGVAPGQKVDSIEHAGDMVVITLEGGLQTTMTSEEGKWRQDLVSVIETKGYENVVEEVAYTWFNRLIAIRYMEVNDYLPTHVRVLSSIVPGKNEPDLVTQCMTVDLGLSDSDRAVMVRLRDSGDVDGLFKFMFIRQCRKLHVILPELFVITKSYENLLFGFSYVDSDGVVRDLVDNIPEDDFRDAVQIIGWMYQYYNSELKDQVFANLKKNVKISKERIPAATQLFTPDWIVRYMVENSVGRVWLEGHDDPALRTSWKYYLDEAEQEPEVAAKLSEMRADRAMMMPSDFKVIDPCMGSGHILVYAFDVLMQIYESFGYMPSDAVEMIVTRNLYGLDIDDRAYQLAYFAVMMKARQYDEDVFSKGLKTNLHPIPESDIITEESLDIYGRNLSPEERSRALEDLRYLVSTFKGAKLYGSLLRPHDVDFELIERVFKDRTATLDYNPRIDRRIRHIIDVARILSDEFNAVITNPPYLASSGMDQKLSKFVKDTYPDSKSDLFACFIERCIEFSRTQNYVSMITQHAFMFLSSFESLRNKIRKDTTITSLLHLGAHAFDQIGGEVVQSVTFTLCNDVQKEYLGTYCRLIDGYGEQEKEDLFISKQNRFYIKQDRFNAIPGSPVAYWLSDSKMKLFNRDSLSKNADLRSGMSTTDNDRFLRHWHEVDINKIMFNCRSLEEAQKSKKKWFPYNKGGKYRKWYGNNSLVLNWYNDGEEVKHWVINNPKDPKTKSWSRRIFSTDRFFNRGITWTSVSSGDFNCRIYDEGFIFDSGANGLFVDDDNLRYYIAAFLNSSIFNELLTIINPTINSGPGSVGKVPFIFDIDYLNEISNLSKKCMNLVKYDWDMYESSWDYQLDAIVSYSISNNVHLIEHVLSSLIESHHIMCKTLTDYEKKIDELISTISEIPYEFGMQYVSSIGCFSYDIAIRNLVSYAIGCMFGRYSLDQPGLVYAGGTFEPIDSRFRSDLDNIIPINDNEYFGDDIVSRFVEFIEIAFGKETLEENLKYIANSLGVKGSGTARERIRKYFLTDFYKDHLRMYSNLPIYWLFDSGKENGFKALIYMHRYNEDLIAKMRQDYLLPMQRRYIEQFESEKDAVTRSKLEKKINEVATYDLAMELYSTNKVSIDLDDGVKVNYAKFQDIDNPGGKGKINLLHKLK